MATITSTGVGSGLDVNNLVRQLVAAERQPFDARLTRIDTRLTTEFTALSQLKGALSTFRSAVSGLTSAASLEMRFATVTDTDALTVTTTGEAVPGSYDVEIVQLARPAQLASNAFAGGGAAVVGSGTLTLSLGDTSFDVTIPPTARTLADVRNAINAASGNPGVRASLVNANDGTRLVLTSERSGAANAIRVTASGGDGGLAQLVYDPPTTTNLRVVATPQDAIVFVSGFEIRSPDNVVEGAIEGVTLNLKEAEDDRIVGLTIGVDQAGIQKKVESFVTAYNALASQMAKLRSFDPTTRAAGPMLGDALLRGIETQVRRLLSDPVPGTEGAYRTLSSLGIGAKLDGTLELDATRFQRALEAEPLALNRVFTGDDGLAARLTAFLDQRLAADGEIATRDAGITSRRRQLDTQRNALELRMEQVQARYLKQFGALDTLLSQLQQTSTYLTQQLGSLQNSR